MPFISKLSAIICSRELFLRSRQADRPPTECTVFHAVFTPTTLHIKGKVEAFASSGSLWQASSADNSTIITH